MNLCLLLSLNVSLGAKSLLTSLHVEDMQAIVRVELLLTAPSRFTSAALTNPNRVYVDLLETTMDSSVQGDVLEGTWAPLQRVRVGQNRVGVTRVVLDLDRETRYRTYYLPNPFRVIIELSKFPVGGSESGFGSRKLEEAGVTHLDSIRIEDRPGTTVVEVKFSSSFQFSSGALLRNPDRLYIDFPNTYISPEIGKKIIPVGSPLVSRVRLGQNQPGIVRIVLDLNSQSPFRLIPLDDTSLRLEVGNRIEAIASAGETDEGLKAEDREAVERSALEEGHGTQEHQEALVKEESPDSGVSDDRDSVPLVIEGGRESAINALPDSPALFPNSPDVDTPPVKVLNELVARVNREFITLRDYQAELALLKAEFDGTKDGSKNRTEYELRRDGLLDEIIERKLLAQRAQEAGIGEDTDRQVDQFIEQMSKNAGLPNSEALEQVLSSKGASLSVYRQVVRERLFGELLIRQVIDSDVLVLESDVRRRYEERAALYRRPAQVRLAEIFLPYSESPDSTRSLAESIKEQLESDAAFEDLASQYSQGTTANEGGDIGLFSKGTMAPDLEREVFLLRPGEITGPIESEDGIQLLRVTESIPEGVIPFAAVQSAIREELEREMVEQVIGDYIEELWSESYVFVSDAFKDQVRSSAQQN